MEQLIASFDVQLEEALSLGQNLKLSALPQGINNIVLAGLGGSGIGGNIAQSLVSQDVKLPFIVCKNYKLPAFVGKNTLFIASSFSGNTEETLACFEEAYERKAHIIVISSGGSITEIAEQRRIDTIKLPAMAACPRAHLGYSMISLLFAFRQLGLSQTDWAMQTQEALQNIRKQKQSIRTEAYQIASQIKGFMPIVYADTALEPVIVRFRQQINENAKQLCHTAVLPEMNHNELVGWHHSDTFLKSVKVMIVHTDYDHERVMHRMTICQNIFEDKSQAVTHIYAQGDSLLGQMLYLIHLTDWVSYELAQQKQVDPFPVKVIDYLKSKLAEI
ncbi:MAG: bifunctional phosphoglucose/phosphomannose isomerase [Bernardetiaceae bacterium]|nr:bifunctional phosphoglucose/phosphomannose isomerase [Bernardetiaceae bacterium]